MIDTALYSFWSKPFRKNSYKKFGEFNTKEDFILSWKTSVELSSKNFNNIILCTDTWSYENLFKEINLPFTDVKIILDNILLDTNLWSISKAYAIKEMTEPFIHIDSDVYIWKKLNENYLKSEVLVQSEEGIFDKDQYILYHGLNWEYKYYFKGSNKYLDEFEPCKTDIYAYNCGILGGNNVDFLKDFAENMIKICEIYNEKPSKLYNVSVAFLEQTLLMMMCQKHNIDVNILLKNNENQNFYTHLAGSTKKDKKLMILLSKKYNQIFKTNEKIII